MLCFIIRILSFQKREAKFISIKTINYHKLTFTNPMGKINNEVGLEESNSNRDMGRENC